MNLNVEQNSATENSAVASAEKTETSAERIRAQYQKRAEVLQQGRDSTFQEAQKIAELIEEPNVLSVRRLVEIFGRDLVADIAAQSWTIFQEARSRGAEAYAKSKEGTSIATKKGQPRTPGGVFFYLMREHSDSLGLRWAGLHLPELPGPVAIRRPNFKMPEERAEAQAKAALVFKTVAKPAPPPPPVPVAAEAKPAAPKPTSGTLKIVGTLSGKPKMRPNNQEGVVELVFKTTMKQGLPKGLPNLGSTRVVVWCTDKQYAKVKASITPQSRFIIEGEVAAAVGADLNPFIRVICMKLSTVELEQALRDNTL